MTRAISTPFILAGLVLLGACDGSKPAAGGSVTMRDMEVVDGTANDSMTDLDNATADGTLLSNAGGLPPIGAGPGASAASENAGEPAMTNSAAPKDSAPKDRAGGNSSAAQ